MDPRKAFEEALKEAATHGETYPDVIMYAGKEGAFFCTNIQIAWAGADPSTSKRRIDDAVAAVREGANSVMRGVEARPGQIDVNSTKYQGVVRVGYFWSGRFVPAEVVSLKTKAKDKGLELTERKFWM